MADSGNASQKVEEEKLQASSQAKGTAGEASATLKNVAPKEDASPGIDALYKYKPIF